MKLMKGMFAVALLVGSVGNSIAAPTADLNIKAKIIPESCDVTIGVGVMDFGSHNTKDLPAAGGGGYALVGKKNTSLNVSCPAPSLLTIKVTGSKGPVLTNDKAFLAHAVGADAVGIINVEHENIFVDSVQGVALSKQGGAGWVRSGVISSNPAVTHSVGSNGGNAPAALEKLTSQVAVSLLVNKDLMDKSSDLDVDVTLTFDVLYI